MSERLRNSFYKSAEWKDLRPLILKRDLYLCQICLQNGIVKSANTVHHIEPLTEENYLDPKITLDPDNLISVCMDCHANLHRKEIERRYTFDEDGNIISK